MTKGARKTGGSRRRELRENFARESRGRREKTKILIVGEGQKTEPNYFYGLRSSSSVLPSFAITVKKGHGRTPEAVIREAMDLEQGAKERDQEYDEVWCVIDVEGPGNRASLNAAVLLAEAEDITLCLSNPCFEVWILSHFEWFARAYIDCDAVVMALNRYWQNLCGRDYQKNDDRIYDRIGRLTGAAIGNAQWVRENHHRDKQSVADANSSTEVYRLVRRLFTDTGGAVP